MPEPHAVRPHTHGPGYICRACEKPHIAGCIRDRDPAAECVNAASASVGCKAPLPGTLHPKLVGYVVEPTKQGGKADDCMLYVTDTRGRWLGHLTVGWFREHTDLADYERADADVRDE